MCHELLKNIGEIVYSDGMKVLLFYEEEIKYEPTRIGNEK